MHELSIAWSLIEGVAELLSAEPGVVRTVVVRIGPLSGVVPEALASAFSLAKVGTRLETATLKVETPPVQFRCFECGTEWQSDYPQDLRCPVCGDRRIHVNGGRELEIAAVELET